MYNGIEIKMVECGHLYTCNKNLEKENNGDRDQTPGLQSFL